MNSIISYFYYRYKYNWHGKYWKALFTIKRMITFLPVSRMRRCWATSFTVTTWNVMITVQCTLNKPIHFWFMNGSERFAYRSKLQIPLASSDGNKTQELCWWTTAVWLFQVLLYFNMQKFDFCPLFKVNSFLKVTPPSFCAHWHFR